LWRWDVWNGSGVSWAKTPGDFHAGWLSQEEGAPDGALFFSQREAREFNAGFLFAAETSSPSPRRRSRRSRWGEGRGEVFV
jgi:hypothetical protein